MSAFLGPAFVGLLTFLTSIFGNQIYQWLVAASGLTGFIAWVGIAISHYRFRRAYVAQGRDVNDLVYKAKWFPFGPILALVMCILVIIGQDLQAVAHFDWKAMLVTYMSVPLFLILFFYYKFKHHTHMIPLEEVDLTTPDIKQDFDEEDDTLVEDH